MITANFDFDRTENWRGEPCSTLNLDHKGNAYERETAGTWEFYAYERDHEHQAMLAQMGDDIARANRTDMDYYWSVSYIVSDTLCEGIADGYGNSLHDCEMALIELWPTIRRYKTCMGALKSKVDMHHYVSKTATRKAA